MVVVRRLNPERSAEKSPTTAQMNASSHAPMLTLALLLLGAAPMPASESAVVVDRRAQLVSQVAPVYPYLMRRAEAAAEVTVLFTVNAEGIVTKASVLDTNNSEFNAPTLDAVKKWTFTPATKNGKAVETKLQQTFTFSVVDKAKPGGASTLVAEKRSR